jgi:hypothetical protein
VVEGASAPAVPSRDRLPMLRRDVFDVSAKLIVFFYVNRPVLYFFAGGIFIQEVTIF